MNPYDRAKRSEDWADRRETTDNAYEPTYRDGSVRHECWNPEPKLPRRGDLKKEREYAD